MQQLQTNWVSRQKRIIRERKNRGDLNDKLKQNTTNNMNINDDIEIKTPIYIEHIQCSALNGNNIEKLFIKLVQLIEKSHENNQIIINKYKKNVIKKKKQSSWCSII